MRVLILPEDFTKDQYMLKPIIEAMMAAVGKPQAIVRVCQEPRFEGVNQLLDWQRLRPVIDRYPMIDLFLLCVDRDGREGRREALNAVEEQAQKYAPGRVVFLAENAWQEIEVWVLAGHTRLPKEWVWAAIRQERDPKEKYYVPFAASRSVLDQPAEGRKTLAEEAARQYRRIKRLCPEDIAVLEARIKQNLKPS